MMEMRKTDRLLHKCPEIDCSDDTTFPMIDDLAFTVMEQEFSKDSSNVYIFPFVRKNEKGVGYVDVYVWDLMLSPNPFQRFIICEGYCLPEMLEDHFLLYIKRKFISLDEEQMEIFNDSIIRQFPNWHYVWYSESNIGQALEHLYYVSHRSGVREILFKADLYFIAYHLDEIPMCNYIGTTPETIIGNGMPLKLLRILNQPGLVAKLFRKESIELCKEIYKEYSGYIGKRYPTVGQWRYLEELYCNGGIFAGHGFIRTLYNRLSMPGSEYFLPEYEQFIRLRDEMKDIKKVKLPTPKEVCGAVAELKKIRDDIRASREVDGLISARKKREDYEYSDDKYCIVMPESSADFYKEGLSQRNCVLYYMKEHVFGQTTILFLRKKNKPEESFVTLEVKDHMITQVFAKCNTLPPKDVFIFLRTYAQKLWLIYDPYMLIIETANDMDIPVRDRELLEYAEKFQRRIDLLDDDESGEKTSYVQMTWEAYFPGMLE